MRSASADKDGKTQEPNRPAYRVLAADLRRRILAGEFPPERRLPTEAELVATHRLSRQTVRQAFGQLVAENLVYRVRGRGSFASPFSQERAYLRSFGSVDELLALSVDTVLEVVKPLERRADIGAAGRLHLVSDEVMVTTIRRWHDDQPFGATTVYLPVDIGRSLEKAEFLSKEGSRTSDTLIGLIESLTPVIIAGAHQSITAVPAPPEIGPLVECVAGEPVLRIDRIYFDRNGKRVELAVSHYNPARYSYRLEMRRGPG